MRRWWVTGILLGLVVMAGAAVALEPMGGLKATDRIIFIGDSITGQGAKFPQGYVNLVHEGILAQHPEWTPTIIPLGGSGHSVSSWLGIEKQSRDAERTLDLPQFGVKASLDQPADVVVIMLGMNDILSPYVSEQTASQDKWSENYTSLVQALRARVKPRLIGLATITMNTDDLKSPKNVMRAALNARIAEIARKENCLLLPAGEEMEAVLKQGRVLKPDFHPTADFVHPVLPGHAAIAVAMLKGLGETEAAKKVSEKYYPTFLNAPALFPALSYTLERENTPLTEGKISLTMHYWWTPDTQKKTPVTRVRLQAPAGWTVTPATLTTAMGDFTLTGVPDRLAQTATLSAEAGDIKKSVDITLPAPWLVGTGVMSPEAWGYGKFTPERAKLPLDETLAKGEGLDAPQTAANGTSLTWTRYQASVDYTGGADPASLDLAQVSFGKTFEVAYAARWIYSPTERPVQVQLGMNGFSGTTAVTLFLNGTQLAMTALSSAPGRKATVDAKLTKGWNLLLLKSHHLQWQWALTCKLAGVGADDLSDLRYCATPKAPEAP